MKLWLVKIELVTSENPPRLKRVIVASTGEDKFEARDVAIEWIKKKVSGTIVAIEVVADFEVPTEPKALFAVKTEFAPMPDRCNIILPIKG